MDSENIESTVRREKKPHQPRFDPALMSIADLADYLRLSYAQARVLVVEGHLPAVRLPSPRLGDGHVMSRLLVRKVDVDGWIDRHVEAVPR